jgi:hypothetical protein
MLLGMSPLSQQALDFDIAIMLRGIYEEKKSAEEHARKQARGNGASIDAEDVSESVLL